MNTPQSPSVLFLPPLALALALLLGAALMCPDTAEARFSRPKDVPVERLVKNLGAYVEAHPTDPNGWYVLGRIHSLAMVMKSHTLGIYEGRKESDPPIVDHQFHKPNEGEPPPVETLREHAKQAIRAFEQALALNANAPRTQLGLAYTLEMASYVAEDGPPIPDSSATPTKEDSARIRDWIAKLGASEQVERSAAMKALRAERFVALPLLLAHRDDANAERRLRVRTLIADLWRDAAIDRYRITYDLAIERDLARPGLPTLGVDDLVAYEAGATWLRLVRARGITPREKADAESIEANLATLRGMPRGPVTPIVFPLDTPRPLADLLAREASVSFDLDGDLEVESWPWVEPDTGILVWDPEGEGQITSGRQLFGSATWWMLWRDGYQALDALDNDRNGLLEADELRGLAVWRDANANGVSDAGEVVPVERLGIAAIVTHSTGRTDGCPSNPHGLRFLDGRTLPTYDWIVRARD